MKIKNQIDGAGRRRAARAGHGFTLLEVMTVLVIIGFMITVVSVVMSRSLDDCRFQQAISNMDKIKTAIRDGFYRDTDLIPQSANIEIITEEQCHEDCHWEYVWIGPEPWRWERIEICEEVCEDVTYDVFESPHPEFATQYLCLKNNCEPEAIKSATYTKEWTVYGEKGAKLRYDYIKCDELCAGSCEFKKLCHWFRFMTNPGWDDYPGDGLIKRVLLCNPPLKQVWNGPYLEGNTAARDQDGEYVPLIATPWASDIEQTARDEGDESLAEKYRKGKYYHIHVKVELDKELPPWPEIVIDQEWPKVRPRSGILQDKTTARIICYGKNGLDDGSYCKEYDDDGNCAEEQETTIEELRDSDFDIGDDMVMFIFGDGFTRSPDDQ